MRLDNVAVIQRGLGPARIERFNRQFQVAVNANNAPDFAPDAAGRATTQIIRDVGLPPGYSYKFSGSVKVLDETTRNLMLAFLLASIFMYMLLGIVKKNGILQVDYTNTLRAQGVPLREAILRANQVRLRPILMTTFSIIAGLVPTAVGIGAGSAQRSAVAVTIIGGQSLCLLLTLLVTPVAYSLLAEAGERGFVASLRPLLARVRLSLSRSAAS